MSMAPTTNQTSTPINVDSGTPLQAPSGENPPVSRPIERNVRGQIISYEIVENSSDLATPTYGELPVLPVDGTPSTKATRYNDQSFRDNIDTVIKKLSFVYPSVPAGINTGTYSQIPRDLATTAAWGYVEGQSVTTAFTSDISPYIDNNMANLNNAQANQPSGNASGGGVGNLSGVTGGSNSIGGGGGGNYYSDDYYSD